ncbi:hypothetical protein BCF46_0937 [Litoreibacter meonggei]|uniref:Uncharacterized protein n=1 Tax=Litoreibacter meonggei TaxID=1049199 RepID=A0A497X769_9RHOB|nr:hypothetical protein [Litoreibacter meonggei]RLJ60733.1 hypothetical protein BCF46_0937 [Litoreibacter meonggei]
MSIFAAVFKRIQLFFFAFTLAASSMMFAGMASGKLERGEVYMGLAEKFATYFASNTTLMEMIAGGDQLTGLDARPNRGGYSSVGPSISRREGPQAAHSSLQALRQRQIQHVIQSEDHYTGG